MSERFRRILLVMFLAVGLAGAGWLAAPRLVNLLPGRIKQRIPHELLALVETPLPTALPAPAVTSAPIRITIPALPTETVTAVPPTFTPQPTNQPTNTPTPTITPTPSPTPLPPSAIIEGVHNIPQKFNNCGPANLSLTLAFYGQKVNQLDIAGQIKPNYDDRNVSPEELAAYVNDETLLRAQVYSGGSLALLKQLIAAGFPVIVEKGLLPSEWEGWMGHYLTVYGYDDATQEFISMDTYLGPWDGGHHTDSYETMAEYWRHFNYTFVLVYPPKRETAVTTLLTTHYTDPLLMWQHAAQTAQKETDLQPDDAFAWFNLGTSLTHLGQLTDQPEFYENATAAFDRARTIGLPRRMLWYQFQPYVAYLAVGRPEDVLTLATATETSEGGRNVEETFLYVGHAYLAAGNISQAKAAYRQALQLNPNFEAAQQALAELN
ncbi:MAG: C39 family peptidase [Ardenticatenaceae bacterium]|nr:C39 family peptidase [Ardenticatenaceae bacterium]